MFVSDTSTKLMIMEPVSQQNPMLECQICLNYYNLRRKPKLLDCQHTCCSVCLTQMKMSLSELRCPWCRSVTTLPPGVSSSPMTRTLWPSSLSHPPQNTHLSSSNSSQVTPATCL
uniref:RING-type domain-containing protein n=1 Tax=Hucho hucho TaxID=62062 RepID=A0A4W5M0Q2_9TELE